MKRVARPLLASVVVIAVAAVAWLAYRANDIPALDVHASAFPAPGAHHTPPFRVTFLGVSTLLFDDGHTAFVTDGYFSRHRFGRVVLTPLEPDTAAIDSALTRLGVDTLDAVIVTHSHFDHALDSATVAHMTGAVLMGGPSAMQVGEGHGLTEADMRPVRGGERFNLGDFSIHVFDALHAPGDRAPGRIKEPVPMRAHATRYRTGEPIALLVEHSGTRVLVHGSAGFVPGMYDGHQADVVYMGIGDLDKQGTDGIEAYWETLVAATGARRVVLIHWDDFFRPLDRPMRPMPRLFQNLDAVMPVLYRLKQRDGVELVLPRVWETIDPVVGLDPIAEDSHLPLRLTPLRDHN